MFKQKAFIARLLRRAGICDFGIRFIPGKRNTNVSGYYSYKNTYVNKEMYPPTQGYVMLWQIGSKLYLAGGFSHPTLIKWKRCKVATWKSISSTINEDFSLDYKYKVTIYEKNKPIEDVYSEAYNVNIIARDYKKRPEILIENFTNPVKGDGACRYEKVKRSEYNKAKYVFNSILKRWK